jgi:hypothetical protein
VFVNCVGLSNSPGTNNNSLICNCNSDYVFDEVIIDCKIDCAKIVNSTGNNGKSACFCVLGFYWSSDLCQINCSALNNTNGSNGSQACFCQKGYIWNYYCEFNCKNIANSTGNNGNDACFCVLGFYWSLDLCQINCSALNNTDLTKGSNGSQALLLSKRLYLELLL